MATARQRAEWLRVGIAVSWVCSALSGKEIDPLKVIPAPYRPPVAPPRKKTEAEIEEESRRAWAVMDRVFGGK